MSAPPLNPGFYWARVMHARHRPFLHRFTYRIFTLLLDIDRLDETTGRLRLLSRNRFNCFSYCDADHGARDGSPLRPWVEARLHESGIAAKPARIDLLAMPRVLGYVFNPLSIYFCSDENGVPIATLYQVHNTFGGTHAYVCPAEQAGTSAPDTLHQSAKKAFYVSPFIAMKARYRFTLRLPGETLALRIDEADAGGPLLVATMTGRRAPLDDRVLLAAFFALPLMTAKVMAAIHWQALRLWFKGARFHSASEAQLAGPRRVQSMTPDVFPPVVD
ncbi:MAG: DUF1365 family protein [Alphaproteobacteria bacterium]|nr:DUF1365 family protein [Alphaproteobacteria bacterium]